MPEAASAAPTRRTATVATVNRARLWIPGSSVVTAALRSEAVVFHRGSWPAAFHGQGQPRVSLDFGTECRSAASQSGAQWAPGGRTPRLAPPTAYAVGYYTGSQLQPVWITYHLLETLHWRRARAAPRACPVAVPCRTRRACGGPATAGRGPISRGRRRIPPRARPRRVDARCRRDPGHPAREAVAVIDLADGLKGLHECLPHRVLGAILRRKAGSSDGEHGPLVARHELTKCFGIAILDT